MCIWAMLHASVLAIVPTGASIKFQFCLCPAHTSIHALVSSSCFCPSYMHVCIMCFVLLYLAHLYPANLYLAHLYLLYTSDSYTYGCPLYMCVYELYVFLRLLYSFLPPYIFH
jgi:hypothetical protein